MSAASKSCVVQAVAPSLSDSQLSVSLLNTQALSASRLPSLSLSIPFSIFALFRAQFNLSARLLRQPSAILSKIAYLFRMFANNRADNERFDDNVRYFPISTYRPLGEQYFPIFLNYNRLSSFFRNLLNPWI